MQIIRRFTQKPGKCEGHRAEKTEQPGDSAEPVSVDDRRTVTGNRLYRTTECDVLICQGAFEILIQAFFNGCIIALSVC